MESADGIFSLAGVNALQINSLVDKLNPACLKSLVTLPSQPVNNNVVIPIPINKLIFFFIFSLLL